MSIPGNLKVFGEIFKYLIRDYILLNQLFFPFSNQCLDSEKALRSKISSLVYKHFKYLNILIIISMYSGYLPNSPSMANDVDRFPTPNMYLQNFRWTCSCFKLLNSFEIKWSFPSLHFFPIKFLKILLPYNNTGFTVWSNKWIIVFRLGFLFPNIYSFNKEL